MQATDKEGNEWLAASYKAAEALTNESNRNVYIIKNNELIGWIDVADEIRPEAKQVITALKAKGVKTILLSGDRKEKCDLVAQQLGIDEVIAEQSPEQKLEKIAAFNAVQPTAMVGDGINDGPALAKATVGISLSDASHVAVQSAQVVLMNHGLKNLPLSLGLGKHTYITIKENLFWAFAYNVVAIPIAAFGLLGTYGPTYGALIMGMSDVVLGINSIRVFVSDDKFHKTLVPHLLLPDQLFVTGKDLKQDFVRIEEIKTTLTGKELQRTHKEPPREESLLSYTIWNSMLENWPPEKDWEPTEGEKNMMQEMIRKMRASGKFD
ncbi:unnamed protein product [Rotaria sordida]|uniref:Uncharacterized protein n=1 Tax=Rotaria sordida TaxID=392033 RepID=A0A813PGB6_9BILA|nr:unnamed protein product [Rotaria sordida]